MTPLAILKVMYAKAYEPKLRQLSSELYALFVDMKACGFTQDEVTELWSRIVDSVDSDARAATLNPE